MTDWSAYIKCLNKINDAYKNAAVKNTTVQTPLAASKINALPLVNQENIKLDMEDLGLKIHKQISDAATVPADGTKVVNKTPIIDISKTTAKTTTPVSPAPTTPTAPTTTATTPKTLTSLTTSIKTPATTPSPTSATADKAAATTPTSTTTASTAPQTTNEATKTEKKEETKTTDNKTSTTPKKSKRTIDEAMKASYPNWDKMTKEEREKKIVEHITTVDKEEFNYLATKNQPDGRIGWLKSFLLNDRMTEEESKTVVGALKDLNVSKEEFAELQAQGVKMAFDDDNQNKESCQIQVAEDMTKYGLKAQKVAVEKTATSQFDNVKIKGSEQASGLDKSIQADAVKQYVEGSKTSPIAVQKQIGTTLVDQYGKFDKDAELDIHKTISTSFSPEVLPEIQEYAANNIWKFDPENQSSAFQITMDTGNEKAINTATANFDKYAECAQPEISREVYDSDYDCAKETLSSFGVTEDTFAEEIQNKGEGQSSQVDLYQALKENNSEAINIALQSAPESAKIDFLKRLSGDSLLTYIFKFLDNNPSAEVLSLATNLLKDVSGQDRENLLAVLNNNDYSKAIIKDMSKKGLLQGINS